MSTSVYFENFLSGDLSASTQISALLSSDYWSDPSGGTTAPSGGLKTALYWIDRAEGITDGCTWVVSSSLIVGGTTVLFQIRLVGTLVSSDIAVQIAVGNASTGWSPGNTKLKFKAGDGQTYNATAGFVPGSEVFDDVMFGIAELILPQIDHVVALMMENRSLDNLLGWIYQGEAPARVLPAGSARYYNGLGDGTYFNRDPRVRDDGKIPVTNGTTEWTLYGGPTIGEFCVPNPDPGEEFDHVSQQIHDGMSGFLSDYVDVLATDNPSTPPPEQIMQCYSVKQLPIISTLATSFAVSDEWFASVPSQTWPNRGFVQTGSSDGRINNDDYVPWDINTVFDVFEANDLSWMVYNHGELPSLTKSMFIGKYLDNSTNFTGMKAFKAACAQPSDAPASLKLPAFSFVEPNFGVKGHDQSYHPPHNVLPGESFLAEVYEDLRSCPYRDHILFFVLFDEHGGTYDHVEPKKGAKPPAPGAESWSGFTFDRFGVRIPAIVVSSWVTPHTVFRSDTSVPLDHTSVLATLRDWQGLAVAFAADLPSPRIQAAPNLAYLLTETTPQPWPPLQTGQLEARLETIPEPDDDEPLNSVQQSVLIGASEIAEGRRFTAVEIETLRIGLKTHGDGRHLMTRLQRVLPVQ